MSRVREKASCSFLFRTLNPSPLRRHGPQGLWKGKVHHRPRGSVRVWMTGSLQWSHEGHGGFHGRRRTDADPFTSDANSRANGGRTSPTIIRNKSPKYNVSLQWNVESLRQGHFECIRGQGVGRPGENRKGRFPP